LSVADRLEVEAVEAVEAVTALGPFAGVRSATCFIRSERVIR